jgi:hypothetical protein
MTRFIPRGIHAAQAVIAGASAKSLDVVYAGSPDNQGISHAWSNSPTDGKKSTVAFWIKRTVAPEGGDWFVWSGGYVNPSYAAIVVDGFDQGRMKYFTYNGVASDPLTEAAYTGQVNDTSWHHVVFKFDSTQATDTNRLLIYLDGVVASDWTQQLPIAQNGDFLLTTNGLSSYIGTSFYGAASMNARFAYFYFIDGQALDPTSFITGTGAGTCHPATYSGTFGTNGFYLNFNDNAHDQSGNGNDWTLLAATAFSTDLPT